MIGGIKLPSFEAVNLGLQTLSIVVASASIALGINAWRRSFVGQKKIDLAEETLDEFYQARDALSAIRNPMSFGGEGSSRKRHETETEDESQILDNAFIVFERYEKYSELFSRLDSKKYRFSMYFGGENRAHFDELRAIVFEVLASSRKLSRHWLDQGRKNFTDEQFERHLERMHAAEAVFWEGGGPDGIDPVKDRIEILVPKIETVCQRAINP